MKSITIDGVAEDVSKNVVSYTFEHIVKDHAIEVVYEKNPDEEKKDDTYKIITEVTHGKITPSVDKIKMGESKVIEYSPEDGYRLKSIIVDGKIIEVTDENKDKFKFDDIKENHTIKVEYEKIPTETQKDEPTTTPTPTTQTTVTPKQDPTPAKTTTSAPTNIPKAGAFNVLTIVGIVALSVVGFITGRKYIKLGKNK